jgi:hypothetical protein
MLCSYRYGEFCDFPLQVVLIMGTADPESLPSVDGVESVALEA